MVEHWSDCAVHNEPALGVGPCDCGGFSTLKHQEITMRITVLHWVARLLGIHIKIGELPYGAPDRMLDERQSEHI